MKILFLDDSMVRQHKRFQHKGDDDLRQVWTASECIQALANYERFDLVSLDHDLEDNPYCDPKMQNCGTTVAKFIAETKPEIGEIIIHSMNHIQAPKMVDMLKKAGYEKVSWQPFNL